MLINIPKGIGGTRQRKGNKLIRDTLLIPGLIGMFVLFLSSTSFAYPSLQLDIGGGWYDEGSESIVTASGTFTLYAILTPHNGHPIDFEETYYISVALTPQVEESEPPPSLGSFEFEGETVNVTEDMTYGNPPIEVTESLQGWDAVDLQTHDIFPTYFEEFDFLFDEGSTAGCYNTQLTPGGPDTSGSGCYYEAFTVDWTGLSPGYYLHFDLYNTDVHSSSEVDVDRDDFAPFSHDAGTVPEPGTLLLLGSGLMGAGLAARKRLNRNR